ncbi:centromere-associated protein E-like isoform X2 [Linepithema humile]|uniref:centromere-associated protein E-like isoform X2 n=1 Tax=Linepithema humile TaxID=83485 RepID=UPI00062325E3|nr:PREDICTED: centromere-associated protein E-like isoform X2 [Linepithema humile]
MFYQSCIKTIESREAGADSDGAIQVSQLNMVDLAGSERARQTGATGERFKEGRHINLSLSTLALVIKQLSEPQESQKYVNFRDSKLTRLLQASLGGNAMTAIICAITPAALDETQCTLSFASRARNVKNKPQLNEVMSDGVLLKRYAKQIDKLHAELEKLKQFAPADFQEMEFRIQEKDRINQNLEKRIQLLQTKIVHGDTRNNHETFKSREKRRQTWCGTGASKLNTSVPSWMNLTPIEEMSPCKLHNRKSTDLMDMMADTSFQIVYQLADFEVELMKSEEARDTENDSDDDFITYRRQNRVKFKDDVIIHKPLVNNDSYNSIPEKIDTSTQTTSLQSPDTPKQTLRDKIHHLSKEYSQLKEFTTLEKQLFIEDYNCETKEKLTKLSTLEKQLENITSDKDAFEHIAAKLRKALTAAEMRYASAEDQLNAQVTELQRIPYLEEKIAQLTAQEMEVQNIPELQKQVALLTAEKDGYEHIASELRRKLNEVEQRSVLLENKLAMQKNHISDTEESFIQSLSKNENVQQIETELETQNITIFELQEKLKEAELCNNSVKEKFNVQQMELLKTIDEQKKYIENFAIERSKLEVSVRELQEKSRETELYNNLLKDKINEQESQLQTTHDLKKEIEYLTLKWKESEGTINELQEKLIKAEQCTSAEAGQIQKIQDLETQITKLMSEKEDCEQAFMKCKSNLETSQKEDAYLKELESTKSMTLDHDCENILLNSDSSKVLEDSSRISFEEDSGKLSADLLLKNQELDEIKNDVQSLKADIENLQKTVYLLTTENSELANKLTEEKECAEKSAAHFQQTIDELYVRNSKITDEKFNLENNLALLNEQIETLRSKTPEQNLSEEQINLKHEERINTLTVKNAELLSNIADTMKELETLKESKSLLYEHDCMYKDRLTNLVEKHEYLTMENNELSTDLMCKIEENDGLRQECNILKNKLELSLKNKEDINDNHVEQLKTENTLLKTELMELKANVKILTEENSKMSNQLMETLEDLDNTRKTNSCNNDFNSSLLNISIMNDTMDKTMEDTAETKILKLQEEVNNLTRLNRKLSDLKSSACTECVHLKELSKSRRMGKLEVKTFSDKLEDAQRKFDRKSAISDSLILKAKEDVNISICNASFNSSVSENMNVSYMEGRLQSLNSELQSLKEDHNELSDLHKGKSNEIDTSQNSAITDSTCEVNFSIKKSSSKTCTRLENIEKTMSYLQTDLEKLKENTVSVKTDLAKFTNEKESSLLDEINSLKTANEQLLQSISESELLRTAALEKANILENNITEMTKKLQKLNVTYEEIEKAKLFLEVEAESLKEEKLMKEQTISELRQSLSCLQHELDLVKKQNDKLNDDNNSLDEEYEKKLELLKAMNEELNNSKTIILQNFADYSKKSEIRLTELDEKINKFTSENDYLKQELIKLRDIENKFEKMKTEYQSKSQQDKILADENKNLKNALNNVSKNIIKEIKYLNPKIDTEKFLDKPTDELFQTFLQTILMKEDEMAKIMRNQFNKEKHKLEDEKRQSVDAMKRMTLWTKELESEIEKLQGDLSERETASNKLQKELGHLEHLLQENNRDRDALREKISLLEMDLGNLQIELNRYSKIDTVNEEAVIIAQKREKQAQEIIKNKEAEFQIKLKSEKETYNKQLEDLTCTIESLKTRNMELTNNIEGLEANQKQLKNIIDLKTNELMKNHQIIQKIQMELEQLTETCNDLNLKLEQKTSHIAKITELLKNKCDELTEYKTNLDIIVPENKLLKQQINERKASIEQHKIQIEKLKMEKKEEIDVIKDKLNIEEMKSVELNNQITELYNKNSALTEKMNALKDDYLTLQHKCVILEKKVRNSTSKVQAEEQMEELKDLNKSLRNNLDGASNRITELQATKTDLMKQLVTLNSQYKVTCKDNQELKETLSSYTFKYNDTSNYEKYDVLLQEKNKVALELEATKVQLNQKNQEIENYISKIKELTEKNTEFDQELEELANVIREYDVDNTRLQDKYYTCRNEIEELKKKIQDLEKKNQDLLQCTERNVSFDKVEKSHDGECSYTALQNKIRELQLEIVSKNGKIATLELQIRSGSFPYQMKCRELQELLSAYKNKNSELKAEVARLMLRTNTKECDVCKQKFVNRRTQACQTIPINVLRFCGSNSGIIEDEVKITKLEKEKQIMKNVCRSRSKTIKELEQRVQELEQLISHSC